jgi:hypothetical protein
MRFSVARSAASIRSPGRTAPTIVTGLLLLIEPRIGAASVAARELGVLAGRNWLLSLLISLLRLGKAAEVTTIAAIHAASTSQRKRTTTRASRA